MNDIDKLAAEAAENQKLVLMEYFKATGQAVGFPTDFVAVHSAIIKTACEKAFRENVAAYLNGNSSDMVTEILDGLLRENRALEKVISTYEAESRAAATPATETRPVGEHVGLCVHCGYERFERVVGTTPFKPDSATTSEFEYHDTPSGTVGFRKLDSASVGKEDDFLLPCPFCGSDEVRVSQLIDGFVVDCFDCGGGCGTCHDEQAARDEWNKRKSLREVLKERGIDSDKVTAEIEAKVSAATPSGGGKWTLTKVIEMIGEPVTRLDVRKAAEVIQAEHNATLPRDCGEEIKAAEKLCELYFNIASEVIGEDEVRRRRNTAMKSQP